MNVCTRCQALLGKQKTEKEERRETSGSGVGACGVCLGAFADDFVVNLQAAIEEAIRPYSTVKENRFCYETCPPTLILPGDLVYRYHLVARSNTEISKNLPFVGQRLKNHARDKLIACLRTIEKGFDPLNGAYPQCVSTEEQGYLAVHVIVLPRAGVVRPSHQLPSPTATKRRNRKRKLAEDSQGGDPRLNLESKLKSEGKVIWTINQALDEKFSSDDSIDTEILGDRIVPPALDFHVAVWRRPFYLRGTYTKSRRDVSQTPFYVVDDGVRRKLGVTSVEEQILPVVSRYSGGISTLNNDPMLENVVFGMAKFHASGREDMDVRMVLPDPDTHGDDNITGRPFVCEVTDALKLLLPDQLDEIVNNVNHSEATNELSSKSRSHGKNPLGVGIAPDLQFVPAIAFKNLQAETENKVKYYGCLCWSSEPLPGDAESLMEKLGSFPLQIQQQTPIRVLHRRANVVRTRHVLSCSARVINSHHFRLHISTDAGTYVKEFVHSDLGRTEPSVATLLGCRCDLLELDCEGIQAA